MNIENDKYVKHFIEENKKLLNYEDESVAKGLGTIIDHAAEICNNREEFFEIMSYGFYTFTVEDKDVHIPSDRFLSNVLACMNNELVCQRIRKENELLLRPTKEEVSSYVICSEDELVESIDGKSKKYRLVRRIKK